MKSSLKNILNSNILKTTVFALIRLQLVLTSIVLPKSAGRLAFRLFGTIRAITPKPKELEILSTARRWELPYTNLQSIDEKLIGYTWNEEAEKTILFIHGWELYTGKMTPLIEKFLNSGFRIIAFNAPAHGSATERSSGTWTNALEYGWAIEQVVRSRFMSQASGSATRPFGIVAHSVGCMATSYFLTWFNPAGAEKIVFIAPPTKLNDFIGVFQATLQLPKRVISLLRRHFEATYLTNVHDADMRLLVRKIQIPLLFIHDREDMVCPFEHTVSLVRETPSSTFIQTEKLGHTQILRSAEVASSIQDFLVCP